MILLGFQLVILVLLGSSTFTGGRSLLLRVIQLGLWVAVFGVFLVNGIYTWFQYTYWQANEFSALLLPPHASIWYFVSYSFFQFFASYLISGALAVLFFVVAKKYNQKFEGRFLYEEELYAGSIGIFLTGWPGCLYYFIGVLSTYLVLNVGMTLVSRSRVRVSSYYLWLPIAALVILVMYYASEGMPLYYLLKLN